MLPITASVMQAESKVGGANAAVVCLAAPHSPNHAPRCRPPVETEPRERRRMSAAGAAGPAEHNANSFARGPGRAGRQHRHRSTYDPVFDGPDASRRDLATAEPSRPIAARRRGDFANRKLWQAAVRLAPAARRRPGGTMPRATTVHVAAGATLCH